MSEQKTVAKEPVFNLPAVVIGLSSILGFIHLLREYVLPRDWDIEVILLFAFWPIRFAENSNVIGSWPGGVASELWSFVTYSFLHGSFTHLMLNVIWMAIFGTAVARRFGTMRFLSFSLVCAIMGALAHLATNWGDTAPMIGASAAISGQMAASFRFVFGTGGPLSALRANHPSDYVVPAQPLRVAISDKRVWGAVVAWFGINFIFGYWSMPIMSAGASIAWQAHVGGFVAGLLLFRFFDPVARR
ncbi:rhomboid family intramembrane serine protease [Flexibacterium corallicola]|uniref:rhomboid family intramembrane serine protease n=1 Tax=Flexibacterium corallicola TaxID=3037259 RepID=UPI00286EC662|nr:rhomboid family intramembrane serine protease [Pseudovibrio sp. M1P-2-3]